VHFAHLLMPHGPYVFDAGCQLRPGALKWRKNSPLYRKENTQSSRTLRYHLYFDQVRCTTRRLQELFERMKSAGLFADALIIVHGDHGSRIFRVAPRAKNKDKLARQDLLDGFSTLFAVRSPA
jgi:arylsulfatase A-like enzyme